MKIILSILLTTTIMSGQSFETLKTYLDNKVLEKRSPGVQFMVSDSSGILFNYNQGKANLSSNEPVTSASQFKMFSVTKLLTMISIMQLVEQNKIDLDDPITSYLDLNLPKDITIRNTLSHTAGFNKNPFLKELHLAKDHDGFNYSTFMAYALPKYNKTVYQASQKNSYSNYGYLVLSAIVERVSDLTYESYVQTHIILRLNLSTNDYIGFNYTKFTAKGYQKRHTIMHWLYSLLIDTKQYYGTKTKKWQNLNDLYMKGLGFGGGFANANGLSKLMLALMAHQLISKKTLETTYILQTYGKNKIAKQTLGWWHSKENGHQSFYHPGGGGGYSCEVRIYPKQGLVRVMLMNATQTISDLKMFREIDKLWLPE